MKSKLRIVFMGTPEFAVASLDALVKERYTIVGVITVPDKPAGRGQQLQQSPVKMYALENDLPVLQPEKLKSEEFLLQLKALQADLQIVVAFRMLPEVVWNMPPLGTFNLHASLLPQYRGAAPINWAVINGEKETGITTFFLQHEIDTGKIILTEKVSIGENETAGELHDKLMLTGAQLVVKTLKAIESGTYPQIPQETLAVSELKTAPKIFKDTCRINWNQAVEKVHNFIRGLSPYPAAWSELQAPDKKIYPVKVYRGSKEPFSSPVEAGSILTDSKTYLKVATQSGFIIIEDFQLSGKKRMKVQDFLRGFPLDNSWRAL